MNTNQITTLLIAAQDIVRAVRRQSVVAYDEAVIIAYDYATEFGAEDIAAAIEELPMDPYEAWNRALFEAAFAIEEAVATAPEN